MSQQMMWPSNQWSTDANKNNSQYPAKSDKKSSKIDVRNTQEIMKSDTQSSFNCSNWKACLIGLVISLLISSIGLAVAITMWRTSATTTSTTTQTTSTTTSVTSTTTTATTTTTSVTTATTTTTTTTVSSAIIYSQNFTNGVASTAQCPPWTSFVAQLTVRPYTLLRMTGTFDTVGVSTTDPTVIANIALALRTSIVYGPVTSNSRSWIVGSCGSGYELSASGTTCQCTNPGYILRPCINHQDYGGINSTTCFGPTQTMTVIFQY